ncbi:AMP-binding protein [Myroides sp. LJL119]
MKNFQLHTDFRFNTESYNEQQLLDWAQGICESTQTNYLQQIACFFLEWFNDKTYIELRTSGTTGTPKLIQLPKSAVITSAKATGKYFDIPNKSSALLCMNPNFVAGKLMLVRAMLLGWHLDVIQPDSKPLSHSDKSYDFVAMVPMQVENSIDQLHRVKCLIIGGAKVSSALKQRLNGVATRIYETYGMTETITHIAAKPLFQEHFEILDHVTISQDHRGCLVIHAPGISKEPIITNDVVQQLSGNSFLWLGRADNVINSGAIKLYPEQIEQKLSPFISSRFFIGSKADSYLGNKVVLVIESKPYTLDSNIFASLDKYEIPKEIQFCEVFVQTDSGKIIRSKNIK